MNKSRIAIIGVVLGTALSALAAETNIDVMRKNFDALMNLQPYINNSKEFRDPKNSETIQKNLDAISPMKHPPFAKGLQEPGMQGLSVLFADELGQTKNLFRQGSRGEYVRNQLKTMTGLCMNCHTATNPSREFEDVRDRINNLRMGKLEKANLMASTRQYDDALAMYSQLVSGYPDNQLSQAELAEAVRGSLNIMIRAKHDPEMTSKFLEMLLKRKDLPEYYQRMAKSWKKQADDWQREKTTAAPQTPEALMAKAKGLASQAASQQLYQTDPVSDVLYLRATRYIHEALAKSPKGKFRPEALYLLGVSYDALAVPQLWSLDMLFFEACIRDYPHTATSKKCYDRYAAKLASLYSTEYEGTFLPEDQVTRLGELRELAK